MDLINRYIYAVTRSFSEKQRADIDKALRANNEDTPEQNQEPEEYEEEVMNIGGQNDILLALNSIKYTCLY